jgi:DNA helicase II / ATP-dependent DNA helicase PcrA
MNLSAEAVEIIDGENEALKLVIRSLGAQIEQSLQRFSHEELRTRELTSQLVAATRDEDRAMLASDEAVSHALKTRKADEIEVLKKQIKQPYFARVVLLEEKDGQPHQIEYKIGFAANPDCRIIDWRKAPISKLYYEYQEGEEYCEQILERERRGFVTLRHTVEINNSRLKRLSCKLGSFVLREGEWVALGVGGLSPEAIARGHLPNVLALITQEQFQTITEEADTAILIQGIAGSGKTTVALHRLAWLLHQDNSELQPEQCLVLVLHNALKSYIAGTLPAIGIEGVRIVTLREWHEENLRQILPQFLNETGRISRPNTPCPTSIARVMRSLAVLLTLEEKIDLFSQLPHDLTKIFDHVDKILSYDDTHLLSSDLVIQARQRLETNLLEGTLDYCCDALLVRLHQLKSGTIFVKPGIGGHFKHIVADEVQDLSPVELATIIGSVKETRRLTLVGDSSQQIDQSTTFAGWEKLRQHWNFKDSMSRYVSLEVSHRSTLPIMQLADSIQQRQLVKGGRQGRIPIWFKCQSESRGIKAAINWLNTAIQRYPNALTAVICHSSQEARQVLSLLKPTFGATVRIGDDNNFSFTEGIIVTDVQQVKGLEFFNVLIWNPSSKNYPQEQHSRNLLYVAITRAEENLCLVTWNRPSVILPPLNSPLLRGFAVQS